MDDNTKLASIRAELPVTARFAYLNTGTNGPLPAKSYEALISYAQRELAEGRISTSAFTTMLDTLQRTRDAIADILGCDAGDVALTHNTTEGVNIALMGIDWRPGDEIVTATTEHPGVLYPAYLLRQRYGVRIRMTDIGKPGVDAVSALRDALSPRTRAVALSHVSWSTGIILPLQELVEITHRVGALFICDAAQSCGMVPSRVLDLGVDAYACSGQKWLCGPDGTGALFVRRDRLGDIHSTFMGYHSVRHGMSDFDGNFVPSEGAYRFETATVNPASAAAFTTSLRWLTDEVGWAWIYDRIAHLGRLCHRQLASIEGVTVLTPQDQMAGGLIHFTVDAATPADIVKRLAEDSILIRAIPNPAVMRASIGFYNTEEEIARLVAGVMAIACGN
jgi:L-cysteine/cystine lyase